jgi:hypothetical protein
MLIFIRELKLYWLLTIKVFVFRLRREITGDPFGFIINDPSALLAAAVSPRSISFYRRQNHN